MFATQLPTGSSHRTGMTHSPNATLFLQDECYKHRYIRSKDVSMIVERPERLRALKIGFAAAIARLEEARGPILSSLKEDLEDPKGPVDAADELTKALDNLNIAAKRPAAGITDICDVSLLPVTLQYLSSDPAVRMIHAANADGDGHDNMEHLDRLAKWARESEQQIRENGSEIPTGFSQGDLYMCPQSYSAICGAVETVRVAVDQVMRAEGPASAFAAVRPPGHHCGEDTPSGFCFVNNVTVAVAHAHLQHGVKKVIIFDIDLHHGNGTQAIAWSINAETQRKRLAIAASLAAEGTTQAGDATEPDGLQIFYASLHDILSFPCEDGDYNLVRDASVSLAGAHGQFIENMHLQPYASHEEFWNNLYPHYRNLFDKAAKFLKLEPHDTNVPIFISCGFDASELEYESMSRHGRKVPVGFYYRFAKDAREFAERFANGKVVSVLEGGYSDRALMAGGLAHLVGLIEEGEGTKSGPDAWWNEKSLEALEKGTKKRKGKQSIGASPESWVERSIEILAAIDPPRSAKPSPPKGIRKLPVATNNTHAPRTSSSSISRRERKTLKTPPPQDALLTPSAIAEPGIIDVISRRKSPRGSDVGLPTTRYSAEVSPGVGGPHQLHPGSSNVNTNAVANGAANARPPWQQWQQSNPERKLPRVILKNFSWKIQSQIELFRPQQALQEMMTLVKDSESCFDTIRFSFSKSSMNNPFDRGSNAAAASLNNPFDSDPTHARNRFPDISQTDSPSPGLFQQNQQQSWSLPNLYSQFPGPAQQQQPPQFQSYGGQTTMNSPYAHSNQISPFATAAGVNPYSSPSSPYSNAGFAAGVASGGSYTTPLANNPTSPAGTPYSHFSAGQGGGGYGGQQAPSYMTDANRNVPQNFAPNPQLSQFDPLNSGGGGGYGQQQQQGYGGRGGSNITNGSASIDPGPVTWYPRSPANPGVQVVSAFGGQTTLHVPIRPHNYAANDHPRHIISMHRTELEQWDQYGWRQALNALENLRIAWEAMRDDIARVTDIGCPPHENAITLKMRKEASEKIDNVTAAYLQMQEVYSSYRQSPDPSSKRRVRDCLNAGLRNLPEWP